MKIIIEGTQEEIKEFLKNTPYETPITYPNAPTTAPTPWWWGKDITCKVTD